MVYYRTAVTRIIAAVLSNMQVWCKKWFSNNDYTIVILDLHEDNKTPDFQLWGISGFHMKALWEMGIAIHTVGMYSKSCSILYRCTNTADLAGMTT